MTAQSLSNLRLRLDEKRAFRIDEFCALYGLGRTKTYDLIKAGKLRTVLVGGRRLVRKMPLRLYWHNRRRTQHDTPRSAEWQAGLTGGIEGSSTALSILD